MFNPTVIRLEKIGKLTGMVIAGLAGEDYYFQVYEHRADGKSYLFHIMPWASQVDAITNFDNWRELQWAA